MFFDVLGALSAVEVVRPSSLPRTNTRSLASSSTRILLILMTSKNATLERPSYVA